MNFVRPEFITAVREAGGGVGFSAGEGVIDGEKMEALGPVRIITVCLCVSTVQYEWQSIFVCCLIVQGKDIHSYFIDRKQTWGGFGNLPEVCKLRSNGVEIKKKSLLTELWPDAVVPIFLYASLARVSGENV